MLSSFFMYVFLLSSFLFGMEKKKQNMEILSAAMNPDELYSKPGPRASSIERLKKLYEEIKDNVYLSKCINDLEPQAYNKIFTFGKPVNNASARHLDGIFERLTAFIKESEEKKQVQEVDRRLLEVSQPLNKLEAQEGQPEKTSSTQEIKVVDEFEGTVPKEQSQEPASSSEIAEVKKPQPGAQLEKQFVVRIPAVVPEGKFALGLYQSKKTEGRGVFSYITLNQWFELSKLNLSKYSVIIDGQEIPTAVFEVARSQFLHLMTVPSGISFYSSGPKAYVSFFIRDYPFPFTVKFESISQSHAVVGSQLTPQGGSVLGTFRSIKESKKKRSQGIPSPQKITKEFGEEYAEINLEKTAEEKEALEKAVDGIPNNLQNQPFPVKEPQPDAQSVFSIERTAPNPAVQLEEQPLEEAKPVVEPGSPRDPSELEKGTAPAPKVQSQEPASSPEIAEVKEPQPAKIIHNTTEKLEVSQPLNKLEAQEGQAQEPASSPEKVVFDESIQQLKTQPLGEASFSKIAEVEKTEHPQPGAQSVSSIERTAPNPAVQLEPQPVQIINNTTGENQEAAVLPPVDDPLLEVIQPLNELEEQEEQSQERAISAEKVVNLTTVIPVVVAFEPDAQLNTQSLGEASSSEIAEVEKTEHPQPGAQSVSSIERTAPNPAVQLEPQPVQIINNTTGENQEAAVLPPVDDPLLEVIQPLNELEEQEEQSQEPASSSGKVVNSTTVIPVVVAFEPDAQLNTQPLGEVSQSGVGSLPDQASLLLLASLEEPQPAKIIHNTTEKNQEAAVLLVDDPLLEGSQPLNEIDEQEEEQEEEPQEPAISEVQMDSMRTIYRSLLDKGISSVGMPKNCIPFVLRVFSKAASMDNKYASVLNVDNVIAVRDGCPPEEFSNYLDKLVSLNSDHDTYNNLNSDQKALLMSDLGMSRAESPEERERIASLFLKNSKQYADRKGTSFDDLLSLNEKYYFSQWHRKKLLNLLFMGISLGFSLNAIDSYREKHLPIFGFSELRSLFVDQMKDIIRGFCSFFPTREEYRNFSIKDKMINLQKAFENAFSFSDFNKPRIMARMRDFKARHNGKLGCIGFLTTAIFIRKYLGYSEKIGKNPFKRIEEKSLNEKNS